ncbi:MAG: hypothetical protein EOO27_39830, partial [Comamonadaceae bacterium]
TRQRREHLTDKRIQLFPDTVESGCIHARMLSRKSRKLEPTRRANKVLLVSRVVNSLSSW